MLTHVVNCPEAESDFTVLVLAENNFPQPLANLSSPDADIRPRHWTHHPRDT